MANHGKCENCWWYLQTKNTIYRPVNGKLQEFLGEGICYMHRFNPISATSYCPDYFRRNRNKQTLQQWIEEHNVPTPQKD